VSERQKGYIGSVYGCGEGLDWENIGDEHAADNRRGSATSDQWSILNDQR
jgi:tryptophan synthase beta subunit